MGDQKPINFVWNWYVYQKLSVNNLKQQTLDSIVHHHPSLHSEFLYKSEEEINELFEDIISELEILTCFNLVASTEASIREKFINKKRKNRIGRDFHKITKKKGSRISLKDDILKTMLEHEPALKREVDIFGELLLFRHWIAHGRYWIRRDSKEYTPEITHNIVSNLLSHIKTLNI